MSHIYNLYITFGTIPALYAQINVFLDKNPSYLWVRSGGHFDVNKLDVIDNLKYYHKFEGYDMNFIKEQYKDVLNKIFEIKRNDSNAKFNIYTDDSRVQFSLKPIILSDINNDIEKIVMISEGNISQYMYDDIKKDDKTYQKSQWKKLINGIKEGNNDEDLLKIENYCFWLSTKKNVEYLIPHINLLYNKNVSNEYKKEMNLKNFNIEKLYAKLPNKYKKNIFGDVMIELNHNDNYIIIVGTYDFGSKHLTAIIYENLLDQMLRDYGKDYRFMFKAHPLFPVSDNKWLEDYLNSHSIIIIPEKIPLEPLLWDNKNLLIGGFCSTINSMINPSRTKFFFGEKIGFSELLDKNNLFNARNYNVLISQKLASGILNIYYENVSIKQALESEINVLQKNYNVILNEKNELSERVRKLEQKIKKIDEIEKNNEIVNKLLNPIRKLKNKIWGTKGSI